MAGDTIASIRIIISREDVMNRWWCLTSLLLGLIALVNPRPAPAQDRLSGRVSNDSDQDDPYAGLKRQLRAYDYNIDDQLKPQFRVKPQAKLDECKAKLQEYVQKNERYKDAVEDAD